MDLKSLKGLNTCSMPFMSLYSQKSKCFASGCAVKTVADTMLWKGEKGRSHTQRKASVTSWLAKRAETGRPTLVASPQLLKARQGKYEF